MSVDVGRHHMLPVTFNVTLPHVPCELLAFDSLDTAGRHEGEAALLGCASLLARIAMLAPALSCYLWLILLGGGAVEGGWGGGMELLVFLVPPLSPPQTS